MRKLPCAGEPLPNFPKMSENTYRIFPVDQSKSLAEVRILKSPSPETFRTVRQGIGTGPPVKNEKLRIRKPDLPVPFEFSRKIMILFLYLQLFEFTKVIYQ